MRVSLNWLNEYIDISNISVDELSSTLTDLGLEVDGVEKIAPITGDLLVGEVVEAIQHPNAENLRLCQVNVGRGEALGIVCGAPNARTGIKVAVAMIGATLPGNFKIKASKIRGESSSGMLCSEKELGLSENHGGIIELPASTPVGESVTKLLQLEDTVLTLGVTPNRADCLGYIGVARDLSARLKRPIKVPAITAKRSTSVRSEGSFKIQIEAAEACGRFSALYVRGVSAIPSPSWMQRRLEAAGVRAINLIVDATNYAMLEYSQPIHAYDVRDIADATLRVGFAKAGEKFSTLDDKEHELQSSDIVIQDGKRTVGLAGVMGGKNSEIRPDTTDVLIEVANFSSIAVRKTARRLGIHTESSHRFERGVDIGRTTEVALRVADLITKGCAEANAKAPEIAADTIDVYPVAYRAPIVALRLERVRQISGIPTIDAASVQTYLETIGIKLSDRKDNRLVFEIPSWRQDLSREIDLIEEVIRIHGINKVPYRLPVMDIGPTLEHKSIDFLENTRVGFARAGLNEVISFPFVSYDDMTALRVPDSHPFRCNITLKNAIIAGEELMQPTMVANMLKAVRLNHRQGRTGVKLFEVGRCYYGSNIKAKHASHTSLLQIMNQGFHLTAKARTDERGIERNVAAGIIDQPFTEKSWSTTEQAAGFFHGKSLVQSWLMGFGIKDTVWSRPADGDFPYLHPGASAVVKCGDNVLGYVGSVHPSTATAYELDGAQAPVIFEIYLDNVLPLLARKHEFATDELPFPPTTRDLAVTVERSQSYANVDQALKTFRRRNLKRFQLFDVYTGSNIASDKKSLAFSLVFQSAKRTLADKEVDQEIELLLKHLNEQTGASIR
jgi:phenylalanyl-tRNA synthetase beta chain